MCGKDGMVGCLQMNLIKKRRIGADLQSHEKQ